MPLSHNISYPLSNNLPALYSGYMNLLWSFFPTMFVIKINTVNVQIKHIVNLLREMQLRQPKKYRWKSWRTRHKNWTAEGEWRCISSVSMQRHIWKKQLMVWWVRLSEQNSVQTQFMKRGATAGREKINWKAGLDVTEIFTDLCVGKMDPDNKD